MKKLLPQIGLLFLLLLPVLGRAQEIRISGQVVDALTKKPVPYVAISLREANTGAITDSIGYFKIKISKSVKQDSVIAMTLNYERYSTAVKCCDSINLVLELIKRKFDKNQKTFTLDGMADDEGNSYMENEIKKIPINAHSQFAFLISNQQPQRGKIKSASFFIGEHGLPKEEFRVRLYKIGSGSLSPGIDILTENVLAYPDGNGVWCTIDLSTYNVVLPDKDFFVALDYRTEQRSGLPTESMNRKEYASTGNVLRPDLVSEDQKIWEYRPHQGWVLIRNKYLRIFNCMVNVETVK